MFEMKNTIDVNSTLTMPELKINILEGAATETIQNEGHKEITLKKNEQNISNLLTPSNRLIHVI